MSPELKPFFSQDPHVPQTHLHVPHVFFSPSRLSQGGFWAKLLVSLVHLHDLAPDTICTWLFSWSASKGVAAGDENSRFLTHSSIRRIFLVRRTNNAAKKNGHLNASSGMGLMRKSQPASSTATNFESGSNSSSQRTLDWAEPYSDRNSKAALIDSVHYGSLIPPAKDRNCISWGERIIFLYNIQVSWSSKCLIHKFR